MFTPLARSRCRSIFIALPRWLTLAGLLLALPNLLLADAARAAQGRVVVGQIDGTITPVMARYVERVIEQAENEDAAAVVFEMDTPGGLSSAMDDIIRDILQSDVPVVVYVTPRGARAASAGVYIAYAAHVAAMAPGTNIGSASPIFMNDDGSASDGSETLQRKVTNDAVAQIRNLAQLRGRNADWAEQAVRDAVNVTADEALSLGVIDLIAPDLPTLLMQIDGRTVQMETGTATLATAGRPLDRVGMSWPEQFLQLLADPTIAYLLISLGLLAIFVELSHPGVTVPGIVGALSLLLGFFALGSIPVDWTGILLIGLAFVLFALDLYLPSFGTLTIGGLVSFVLGSYLLVGDETPGYAIAPAVIWTMTACLLAFSLFLGAAVLRARLRPPATGVDRLVGTTGVARTALEPRGTVALNGELWEAALEGPAIRVPEGEIVVVIRVRGLRLAVRPATAAEAQRHRAGPGDARYVVASTAAREQPSGGRARSAAR